MRNLSISMFVCLYFSIPVANAQKVSVGIEGGPSLVALTGNSYARTYSEPKASFSAGFSSHIKLYKIVAVDAGLFMERKGAMTEAPSLVEKHNFDYLSLPVLAGVDLRCGKRFTLFGGIGGYASYLVQQRVRSEYMGKSQPSYSNKDLYKDTDFGLVSGIKAYYTLTDRLRLSLGATYAWGLSNISDGPVADGGEINNRSANMLIGIQWTSKQALK